MGIGASMSAVCAKGRVRRFSRARMEKTPLFSIGSERGSNSASNLNCPGTARPCLASSQKVAFLGRA